MESLVGRSWFKDWFNTRYYHILYQNRNEKEAEEFIENLLQYLDLEEGSDVLDLACGKGRHSKFLSEHDLCVTGIDLSGNSIQEAKKMENENLSFQVQDMRTFSLEKKFDAILNLFTSFGYFDGIEENCEVLKRVNEHLKQQGKLVIDFLNVNKVLESIPEENQKTLNGITFNIRKELEEGIIVKYIQFEDEGEEYEFQERVQALSLEDFETMLTKMGFEIIDIFGDYKLSPYREGSSERLIIIAE